MNRFLGSGVRETRILSRDEKSQEDISSTLSNPNLRFYFGDVRDYDSVLQAMNGMVRPLRTALKQVPSSEFYPMKAVRSIACMTDEDFTRRR